MGRIQQDIEIVKGDSFAIELQATDENGSRVDLEGCTLKAQFRKKVCDKDFVNFETEVTQVTQGIFLLKMPPESTKNLPCHNGVWDVCYETPTGERHNFMCGTAKVTTPVTRRW